MQTNRIAIITGAARGIGFGIARVLSTRGIVPAIVDIDQAAAEAAAAKIIEMGIPARAFTTDVSDPAQVAGMVAAVAAEYGRVDILVNNAGILNNVTIEEMTGEIWDRVMAVNVKSAMFCSQQALKHMTAQGWGRIINIASMAGRNGGISTGCAYSTSKAALIGMTMCMAKKVARLGITVNALAPGPTETDLFQGFTPKEQQGLRDSIPVGRMGTPEQIGEAVAFLAAESSGYITGAVLDINGGLHIG